MANIRKSFNFRNGVQVDDDNFVVNANGLVGIGSTIPTEVLDVIGNATFTGNGNFVGFVSASSAYFNNSTISTSLTVNRLVNVGITSITSGIITASTGIVTYYGDARYLQGMPTSQWVDVDSGLGYTSIYAAGNVGIATTYPNNSFQVGGNPDTHNGVGIGSTGTIKASGSITGQKFIGIGSDITNINASNITLGTLNTLRLPSDINVSGIVTAGSFSGIGSNITNINASNIGLGTLNNSRLPSDINVSGIVTAGSFSGIGSNITNINASNIGVGTLSTLRLPPDIVVSGIVTAGSFSGIGSDLTVLNASNITLGTLNTLRLPSDINVSGIVTAGSFSGTNYTGVAFTGTTFTGNLTGTASTAQSLTGTPNISVGVITSTKLITEYVVASGISTFSNTLHVGSGGTALSVLPTSRIGIGTSVPSSEIQIRKSNDILIECISSSGESRISLGNSESLGNASGSIVFGNYPKTLDIINHDTGNFNMYLHAGGPGINTGRFAWIYGQNNTELASLTYDGNLGLGITNTSYKLNVVGTSSVTGNAFFSSNVTVLGTLNASVTFPGNILANTNLNVSNGISTVNSLNVINSIGINTSLPLAEFDAKNGTGLFASVGIGTTSLESSLKVNGFSEFDTVGIGTTQIYNTTYESGAIQIHNNSLTVFNGGILVNDLSYIGFGTFYPRSILDFANVGTSYSTGYMIPPIVTTTQRGQFTNFTGVGGTVEGAIIYNATAKKHQGYNGTGWYDLY